jgi:dTDP-glucose pyrophosphorylase/CBS domain-containing protein
MTDTHITSDFSQRLEKVLVAPEMNMSGAIRAMDDAGLGVLMVAGDDRRLLGVLTDGDFRRAILRSVPSAEPCLKIATRNPVVAPSDVTAQEALYLMDHSRSFAVNHLPLVDEAGRVVGLVLRRDFVSQEELGLSAVVMAGGFGTRLRPLTERLPKPMLPVGDRPLMELVVGQLREAGVRRVSISTHYQGEAIASHFGDGASFGVKIDYVSEDSPLGTAGALALMPPPTEPLLVINGDILTRLDFRAMLDYHREHRAALTVAVRQYDLRLPYGVVESDGPYVKAVTEKPDLCYLVNAGIYLLDPIVHGYLEPGARLDMTDLIARLLAEGLTVVSFPLVEYWLDVGQHADYEQAQVDVRNGRMKP